VCLYQNWEGTDASKRRIRRYRYSTVVSVCVFLISCTNYDGLYLPTVQAARDIGIVSARHSESEFALRSELDWQIFAAREEYIR
jgi:hypothetical protein